MKKQHPQSKAQTPSESSDTVRLQKFLAEAGLCSRRGGNTLVEEGRVTVDGELATSGGQRIDPARSKILVDGRPVKPKRGKPHIYLALNKPRGFITTMEDPAGRKTVKDLLVGVRHRVVPVGRLDRDSEGLLLFTNDGDLIYRLTHPKYEIEKEYHVTVDGVPTENDLTQMREGIEMDGSVTKQATVRLLDQSRPGISVLSVTLKEGRKRQVRRMCEAVGLSVRRLMRVREGKILLGDLPPGNHRVLKPAEVKQLRKETRLD